MCCLWKGTTLPASVEGSDEGLQGGAATSGLQGSRSLAGLEVAQVRAARQVLESADAFGRSMGTWHLGGHIHGWENGGELRFNKADP